MFFNKKLPEPPPEFTVSEFVVLDAKLTDIIMKWVDKEARNENSSLSKFNELRIFNFKILYSDTKESQEMRDFFINKNITPESTDYTFSRIHDLYIIICSSFPKRFIEFIKERQLRTLSDLGYEIDTDIVKQFPFGWLFFRIQHVIRFEFVTK